MTVLKTRHNPLIGSLKRSRAARGEVESIHSRDVNGIKFAVESFIRGDWTRANLSNWLDTYDLSSEKKCALIQQAEAVRSEAVRTGAYWQYQASQDPADR